MPPNGPRPATLLPCLWCGRTPSACRNLCAACYHRAQRNHIELPPKMPRMPRPRPERTPRRKPSRARHVEVKPVTADRAWPDSSRAAPTGQRLAVYLCPSCKREHLVGWLPIDADPGLKTATCGGTFGATGGTNPQYYVSAPPAERVFTEKPPEPGIGLHIVDGAEAESENIVNDDEESGAEDVYA